MVLQDLGNIRILPKHIWKPIEDAGENIQNIANPNLLVWPYKLLNYIPDYPCVDDNYWGLKYFGTPAPTYCSPIQE